MKLAERVHQALDSNFTANQHEYAVSIVIPIHNEAGILVGLIEDLKRHFDAFPYPIEFLFCENGSSDDTKDIVNSHAARVDNIRVLSLEQASYGAALRMGIMQADADYVLLFNADLWCFDFFIQALVELAEGADLVVGSKLLPDSRDNRPPIRRLISSSFNEFLRIAFGFQGTDTHGIKALRRSSLVQVLERCVTDGEVFDTEFVIRAQRAGLVISELPVSVDDIRPARLSLLKRVPSTARDLFRIWRSL